jgi:hypothetical protein
MLVHVSYYRLNRYYSLAENCLISGRALRGSGRVCERWINVRERAQIVRLDARWIAMLRRYHLEFQLKMFISASGETDSQLGNTL